MYPRNKQVACVKFVFLVERDMTDEEWKLSASPTDSSYRCVLEENFGSLDTPPKFVPCERMHPGLCVRYFTQSQP